MRPSQDRLHWSKILLHHHWNHRASSGWKKGKTERKRRELIPSDCHLVAEWKWAVWKSDNARRGRKINCSCNSGAGIRTESHSPQVNSPHMAHYSWNRRKCFPAAGPSALEKRLHLMHRAGRTLFRRKHVRPHASKRNHSYAGQPHLKNAYSIKYAVKFARTALSTSAREKNAC